MIHVLGTLALCINCRGSPCVSADIYIACVYLGRYTHAYGGIFVCMFCICIWEFSCVLRHLILAACVFGMWLCVLGYQCLFIGKCLLLHVYGYILLQLGGLVVKTLACCTGGPGFNPQAEIPIFRGPSLLSPHQSTLMSCKHLL